MDIITVKYPTKTLDWDSECLHDANRLLDALRKKWPNTTFGVQQVCTSEYKITSEHGVWLKEMNAFAEGFIASSFLWER